VGHAPGIALVLHPRRDPGSVLDAIGAWAASHGSRLLMRAADAARWDGAVDVVGEAELAEQADAVALDLPFLPDELRELASPGDLRGSRPPRVLES